MSKVKFTVEEKDEMVATMKSAVEALSAISDRLEKAEDGDAYSAFLRDLSDATMAMRIFNQASMESIVASATKKFGSQEAAMVHVCGCGDCKKRADKVSKTDDSATAVPVKGNETLN